MKKIIFLILNEKIRSCGIHDFSLILSAKLCKNKNFRTKNIHLSNWSILSFIKIKSKISDNDILFINYPNKSMGSYLGIFFLNFIFIKNKIYFFLHEFNSFNIIRKILFYFLIFKNYFLFSNQSEKSMFKKFFIFKNVITSFVVPIPSNIPKLNFKFNSNNRSGILYFGLISKKKIIFEDVKLFILKFRKLSSYRISIIGSITDYNNSEKEELKKFLSLNNVDFFESIGVSELSKLLLTHKIAYLPYEEGASEKNATLIACIEHGLNVFTTYSDKTSKLIKQITNQIYDHNKTIKQIDQAILSNKLQNITLREKFISAHSWDNTISQLVKII